MKIENMDAAVSAIEQHSLADHLNNLHRGFKLDTMPIDGIFQSIDASTQVNIGRFIGIDPTHVPEMYQTVMDATVQMMDGIDTDGIHTLGLNEISQWKINPEYQTQNIRQQAGYAAEVISTCKENLKAMADGSGIRTYRADDLPGLFSRNDQYVDKVRMNAAGDIVERIQTKFIGGSGKEWLSKMMSPKFEKYLDGNVDKIECPKNYYDDVKATIAEKRESYQQQLERVSNEGKADAAAGLRHKIEKLDKLDDMVEQSTVTSDEAIYARQHPKAYTAQIFSREIMREAHDAGLESGALAAGLTLAVSTVDNIKAVIDGEITVDKMVLDIAEDTAKAGALGYGTSFISTAVAQTMQASSSELIHQVGESCLPAAAVSFAVESYQDISDFAQGKTDGLKLAYNLGENAAKIVGGLKGGAIAGTAAGAIAGPVGAAAGGIIGGMIGCVTATEIYKTAVELGTNGAAAIADKAVEFAGAAVDAISEAVPNAVNDVRGAINGFLGRAGIGLRV